MTDTTDEVATRRSNLRAIEGGRHIKARDVQDTLFGEVNILCGEVQTMAGFAVIAWDDEGFVASSYHTGDRNPYAPPLLPDIIAEEIQRHISAPMNGGDDVA